MNKEIAVFLDRDGTINKDRGYICRYEDIEIFPYAIDAIKVFRSRGFKVLVVTNQASIARAICTEEQVRDIHRRMNDFLQSAGAPIDAYYYSPYHEEGVVPAFTMKHEWRKPSPGMILQGAEDFNVDLARSYMVGDSAGDIIAGKRAGCRTILVLTGHGVKAREELAQQNEPADYVVDNLWEAVQYIK